MLSTRLVFAILISSGLSASVAAGAQTPVQKIEPVSYSQVQIEDEFWKPRLDQVSRVTIPVCIDQTESKTPRIRNFEKAARRQGEKHEGIYYDDSDVYKALEAMAYALKNRPDPALEKKADAWIDKIAAAQEPDGYLNTYYTLTGLDQRWTDMEKHEDYCAGHLIEAAVAYYNTTGKRKLLDVAVRFADHIDSTFRGQNRPWVSGHQEIELALMKLYHLTKKDHYLQLADWFLDQRGRGRGKGMIWNNPEMGARYCQDDVPVKGQREITGHAVRAMYLYTGAADVAAVTGDGDYLRAMQTVWEDVVNRNMYITGGIGSSGRNEGFSVDYDLPNEQAYCETCASVGMVFWNQRMNRLTGEGKYVDVLERSLYNGALDGLSLSGDRFFYGNPLASSGQHARSEWFGTACCPSNISRLVESLGDYVYAKTADAIWVNLFVGSSTTIPLKSAKVHLTQQTRYPWEGTVQITVSPERKTRFPLRVRVPGWALNQPTPGTMYRFADAAPAAPTLLVNGKPFAVTPQHGYAVIEREWKKGDVVVLSLPMPVRRIAAVDSVKADQNRVALQRGPLVYCVEHADNGGKAMNVIVPDAIPFTSAYQAGLLGGVVTLQAETPVVTIAADGVTVTTVPKKITAIPYYAWANRGKGQMQVWLPRRAGEVKVSAE